MFYVYLCCYVKWHMTLGQLVISICSHMTSVLNTQWTLRPETQCIALRQCFGLVLCPRRREQPFDVGFEVVLVITATLIKTTLAAVVLFFGGGGTLRLRLPGTECGVADPWNTLLRHRCCHAKCHRSRSNRLGVGMGSQNFGAAGAAPMGWKAWPTPYRNMFFLHLCHHAKIGHSYKP